MVKGILDIFIIILLSYVSYGILYTRIFGDLINISIIVLFGVANVFLGYRAYKSMKGEQIPFMKRIENNRYIMLCAFVVYCVILYFYLSQEMFQFHRTWGIVFTFTGIVFGVFFALIVVRRWKEKS